MNLFERILSKDEITARFVWAVNAVITSGQCSNKASLAESLGVKPAKFSEILNGRMKVGLDMIARMCDFYKVDPDWLLMGRGNNVFRTTPMAKYWVDDGDLNTDYNNITSTEESESGAKTVEDNEAIIKPFISMIANKDMEIGNLREEIGRLKARNEELEKTVRGHTSPQHVHTSETVPT